MCLFLYLCHTACKVLTIDTPPKPVKNSQFSVCPKRFMLYVIYDPSVSPGFSVTSSGPDAPPPPLHVSHLLSADSYGQGASAPNIGEGLYLLPLTHSRTPIPEDWDRLLQSICGVFIGPFGSVADWFLRSRTCCHWLALCSMPGPTPCCCCPPPP